MRIEKLDLKHKELLFDSLKKIDSMISEYSFANLYLFRRSHDYEIVDMGNIFVRGITYDGKSYYMPTVPFESISESTVKQLLNEVDFIFPLDYDWLRGYDGDEYCVTSNINDTDYIYSSEKMSTFKGRNLHGKRNLLKQFSEKYSCDIKPLQDNKNDAFEVLERWQEDSGEAPEETDFYANMDAINYFDKLVICGLLYYIGDKPVGFIIGEEIREDTFVIHFAKALKGYKGIYQYIYNSFANMLPKRYKYLNFEQDLGKPSLRLAKSSYEPDIMLHKYRLSLRERCLC
ncbi:MAG: phosphatidylglycerol lysyltransferase domain-containing protein [Calditerrivibrio sp.]|nr:phosphatidylglycerol lysyltransferase domain-containing protein [Calditerrivibrio sp.]